MIKLNKIHSAIPVSIIETGISVINKMEEPYRSAVSGSLMSVISDSKKEKDLEILTIITIALNFQCGMDHRTNPIPIIWTLENLSKVIDEWFSHVPKITDEQIRNFCEMLEYQVLNHNNPEEIKRINFPNDLDIDLSKEKLPEYLTQKIQKNEKSYFSRN